MSLAIIEQEVARAANDIQLAHQQQKLRWPLSPLMQQRQNNKEIRDFILCQGNTSRQLVFNQIGLLLLRVKWITQPCRPVWMTPKLRCHHQNFSKQTLPRDLKTHHQTLEFLLLQDGTRFVSGNSREPGTSEHEISVGHRRFPITAQKVPFPIKVQTPEN